MWKNLIKSGNYIKTINYCGVLVGFTLIVLYWNKQTIQEYFAVFEFENNWKKFSCLSRGWVKCLCSGNWKFVLFGFQ